MINGMTSKIYKINEQFLTIIESFLEIIDLLFNAFKNLLYLKIHPVRTVLFRQIYFSGIEALGKTIIIGLLMGIVIITQITSLVGIGSGVLTGKILIWIIVREFGPLFTAVIIIARSVTAISAELGSMTVQGEIDNIKMLGIDPSRYLIMPRILALTLSSLILTFYFEFSAIFGGIAITSLFVGVSFEQYTKGMLASLTIFEILVSLLKSFVFGMLISAVSCSQGIRVAKSITQIPQATTRATIQSLFVVLIFDGIITFIFFV